MPQFDRFPIRQVLFGRPIGEFFQQRGVSFLGVLRLPAFMTQVLQKIFNERLHGLNVAVGLPPGSQNAFCLAAAMQPGENARFILFHSVKNAVRKAI